MILLKAVLGSDHSILFSKWAWKLKQQYLKNGRYTELWRTTNTFRGEKRLSQGTIGDVFHSNQLRYLPPVKRWDRKHTQRWKMKVYLLLGWSA